MDSFLNQNKFQTHYKIMDKGSALPVPPEMGQAGQLNVGQAVFLSSCISTASVWVYARHFALYTVQYDQVRNRNSFT